MQGVCPGCIVRAGSQQWVGRLLGAHTGWAVMHRLDNMMQHGHTGGCGHRGVHDVLHVPKG